MTGIKMIIGLIMIGGALLITGINVKISESNRPVPSTYDKATATPEDVLINRINRRVEMDQLREGRAGR